MFRRNRGIKVLLLLLYNIVGSRSAKYCEFGRNRLTSCYLNYLQTALRSFLPSRGKITLFSINEWKKMLKNTCITKTKVWAKF